MHAFRILATVTLLADGYILLALIATSMMKPRYYGYLPPFHREDIQAIPDFAWLAAVIWTALLAAGCFWPRRALPRGETKADA
jgi:hypothetical protein